MLRKPCKIKHASLDHRDRNVEVEMLGSSPEWPVIPRCRPTTFRGRAKGACWIFLVGSLLRRLLPDFTVPDIIYNLLCKRVPTALLGTELDQTWHAQVPRLWCNSLACGPGSGCRSFCNMLRVPLLLVLGPPSALSTPLGTFAALAAPKLRLTVIPDG